MPDLATALDAERQAKGLSVNELARRADLSAGRVHDILHGKTLNPGILTTLKLLTALGCDLRWLQSQLNPPPAESRSPSRPRRA